MKQLKVLSFVIILSAFSCLKAEDLSAVPKNGWANASSKSFSDEQSPLWTRSSKKKPKQKPIDYFLVDVGAVYLRPYQGGTDFAQLVSFNEVNPPSLAAPQIPYGKNKALDFDYDWGVRASLGYQFKKSHQTIRATYLYTAPSAHKSTTSDFVNVSTPFNLAVHSTNIDNGINGIGDYVQSAHTHWKLYLNMLDLTFGKKYLRNKCMSFEPFIGAKGLLLYQTQKFTFINNSAGNSGKLKQRVNFEGAGVMGGLNLDWVVVKWLSLFGSVDGALLYSAIKTTRFSDNGLPTVLWSGSNHDIKGTTVLEGSIGMRGVYCLKKGRYIDLKLGFEEHYFFQALKHYLVNSDISTDLSLMGWFATLGFAF